MIHPKLEAYIATRDRKIAKFWPHEPNCLRDQFVEMMERGRIRVGGRSTCGGSDPTMHAYRAWNEVIRKARSLGYGISETDIRQQGNAWASRGGGFWNETEYRLDAAIDPPEAADTTQKDDADRYVTQSDAVGRARAVLEEAGR